PGNPRVLHRTIRRLLDRYDLGGHSDDPPIDTRGWKAGRPHGNDGFSIARDFFFLELRCKASKP
ncbi:hypothetical protein, partial [Streptococcus pseudopneumoniae]|uniref:hypothetical protein n=1 Tax=Streptococcus pseudopneumoniae TaxID=257758 RepID=UPI001BB21545